MKSTLTLLVPLFFSLQILAQAYQPMAVEGAHWVMYAIGNDGPEHHIFVLCGDTTLNGAAYKKMYREHLTSQATAFMDFGPPYFSDAIKLIGAIRDEVPARKVYYVAFEPFSFAYDTCELFQEVLLHDFSKTVGDTLEGCLYGYPDAPAVLSNSYSEMIFGENRTVSECDCGARLVEGLGTDTGPFYPLPFFIHPAKPQALMDYFVETVEACPPQILTSTDERELGSGFEISPNPADDWLTVTLPATLQGHFSLTVSDLTGKVVWQNAFSNTAEVTVPLENLPQGAYLLTLQAEGWASTRKFVAQR